MTSPVQNTNIEQILYEHLWDEIIAVESALEKKKLEMELFTDRMNMLKDIAKVAGIQSPIEIRT